MENFTAGHNRNYTSTSIQSSTLPIGFAEFLFALNIFLSIATSLSNILILIALCKASSLHPPTKLLFRCLAVTDLCVGLVTHPALSAFVMLYLSHTREINASVFYFPDRAANASGFVFCEASIMVSTAISVDRLLDFSLCCWGLRYRHVATLWRVRAVLISLWLAAISMTLLGYFWRFRFAIFVFLVIGLLSLAILIFSYINIFL